MGFHLEAVVTQPAGQREIADVVNGFNIYAGIGFGRVGKFVGVNSVFICTVFHLLFHRFIDFLTVFLFCRRDGEFRVQKCLRFDFLMAVVDTVFQQGLFGKAAVEVEVRTTSGDSGMVGAFYIACVAGAAVIGGIAFFFQHIGVGIQFFDKAQVFTRVRQVGVGLGSFAVSRGLAVNIYP
ncbi:Uncharacterised protein [Neisseria meningitidis]|nr:Uncharacterised protein [Neisseria meningitidis]CWS53367.1 Uncharacterised protein [Neisseria meningitidis]CWT38577.1 Uncharacterised protein [Neisseria meningitidis]